MFAPADVRAFDAETLNETDELTEQLSAQTQWKAHQFVLDCIAPHGKEGFYHLEMVYAEQNKLRHQNGGKEKSRMLISHKKYSFFPRQLLFTPLKVQ